MKDKTKDRLGTCGVVLVALLLAVGLMKLSSTDAMKPLVGDNSSLTSTISPGGSPASDEEVIQEMVSEVMSDEPMKTEVYDPNTMQRVYPPSHKPCSFGYKSATNGCVTRGKFAVTPSGVWGVACRLGDCHKFGKLCVFVPRSNGWGDKMLLPAEIEYREVPIGARAGAC